MEPAAGPDHLSSCPNKLAAGARSGPVFTTAAVSGGGGEGGGGGGVCVLSRGIRCQSPVRRDCLF